MAPLNLLPAAWATPSPPQDKRLQNWLFGEWAAVSEAFGFEQVDFPVLESGGPLVCAAAFGRSEPRLATLSVVLQAWFSSNIPLALCCACLQRSCTCARRGRRSQTR